MSKKRKRVDENQGNLFDLIEQINAPKPQKSSPGQFRIIDDLRESLRNAIKESPMSRHQVAGEMSHMLDESITKAQLDSWTRDTDDNNKPNRRHVPAEYLPAFCEVTGWVEPIRIQNRKIGCQLMPPKKELQAELGTRIRKRNEENKIIKRIQTLLNEMEKR